MSYKLVDTIRNKVLQEFNTKEEAERALSRQSVLDYNCVELQSDPKPQSTPKKASKKVKADGK